MVNVFHRLQRLAGDIDATCNATNMREASGRPAPHPARARRRKTCSRSPPRRRSTLNPGRAWAGNDHGDGAGCYHQLRRHFGIELLARGHRALRPMFETTWTTSACCCAAQRGRLQAPSNRRCGADSNQRQEHLARRGRRALVGTFANGYSGYARGGVWTRKLKRAGNGATAPFEGSEKGKVVRPAIVILDRGDLHHPQRRHSGRVPQEVWIYFFSRPPKRVRWRSSRCGSASTSCSITVVGMGFRVGERAGRLSGVPGPLRRPRLEEYQEAVSTTPGIN